MTSCARAKIEENVDLMKTIPPASRKGWLPKFNRHSLDEPFNQQGHEESCLREEGKSAGYNLKRFTRDHGSNKLTGHG